MNNSPITLLSGGAGLFVLLLASPLARSQGAAPAVATSDRQRMLALLNLPTPPTPNKNRNHDEAKATLFPNLPDPLILKNGQPVKDAATWWNQRRPEVFDDLMTEVYGKIPANTPKITWEVTAVSTNGTAKIKTIVGHIDNSSYPAATPSIQMTLYLPANATGPVPVIVEDGTGGGGLGRGAPGAGTANGAGRGPAVAPLPATPPNAQEMAAINNALVALIEQQDPATKSAFDAHPRYAMITAPPGGAPGGIPGAGAAPGAAPGGREQVLAKGWGFATFNTGSVQQDSAAGLTNGIIGLVNKGQPRSRPDEWGVLAAWAWGLSKACDYFETDPDVDAKQLGLEGFSRWGKTAVLAAAIEPRWVVAWAGDSGAGGVKLNRRDYGESLDDVCEENESYWMAGNYLKYANHHWGDLPVDSHELVALVAPRAVFITGGTADQNTDANGMFLAGAGAGPVYKLLGKQDLGATEMPKPDVALISGDLGFREHTGAHIQAPDWPSFVEFAGKYLHAPAAK